jgi:hypothetical protein
MENRGEKEGYPRILLRGKVRVERPTRLTWRSRRIMKPEVLQGWVEE